MKQKKKVMIALIAILVIQTVFMIYVGDKKEGFHIDEYVSYGLMNYPYPFLLQEPTFLDHIHSNEYFSDYIEINQEEVWNLTPVYSNQVADVHPPFYYLLLRMSATFCVDDFSKWTGLGLNILISLLVTVFLYRIAKKLFKKERLALAFALLNVFCVATIQTVMLIRMYELLSLAIIMLLDWHLSVKDQQELSKKSQLTLFLLVLLGFLTHYYYAICVIALYGYSMIRYIKQKQYEIAKQYTFIVVSSAIIGVILFPACVIHIFFGYRGQQVISNLFLVKQWLNHLIEYIHILSESIFLRNGLLFLFRIFGNTLDRENCFSKKKRYQTI